MGDTTSAISTIDVEAQAIKAMTKKEADGEHPASHYLVVEDAEKPGTWHLRVQDVDGNPDHRLMGAAWAALHQGYRGNRYDGPGKQAAIDKLRRLYEQEGMASPVGKSITTAIKLLNFDDDTVTIGGYGVVFGGSDLVEDTFKPDTDLGLDIVPHKPIYYDHTLGKVKNKLGEVVKEKADEMGLWIEAQLDRHREYVDEVMALLKKGALGWSSGAVAHLVEREGRMLKRWPIYEFSLTPTPAEPRTLGVELIKTLAEADPRLKAFLPQGAEDAPASAGIGRETANPKTQHKERIMSEDTVKSSEVTPVQPETETVVVQPEIDIKALIAEFSDVAKNAATQAAQEAVAALADQPAVNGAGFAAPAMKKVTSLGFSDEPIKSFAYFVKTGDEAAFKASNDTTMNITTSADGGYAVPTGHYNGIIARRDDSLLAKTLGVRDIPGRGTTVNVPIDNEADGEFVSTAESAAFDRDAPALNTKAMTLVMYTKKVDLTYQLLDDEDSRLLAFLQDFIGRGMAKTHNNLLLTEVASNGTALKTYASATAIAAGELEDIAGNQALSPYLDDQGAVAWVMRSSTFFDVMSITGSARLYADFNNGTFERNLLGFPVQFSAKAAATAASAKDAYFGNWNFVGVRNAPEITFVRDPYTRAAYGEVILNYHFRTVYGVLQAEAVGYGVHPTG